MRRVGGNGREEKERFIVQDSVRGHEENGNKLTMTTSPQGSTETQTRKVPCFEETRASYKLPLRSFLISRDSHDVAACWSSIRRPLLSCSPSNARWDQ